jgi:hypothetical protein
MPHHRQYVNRYAQVLGIMNRIKQTSLVFILIIISLTTCKNKNSKANLYSHSNFNSKEWLSQNFRERGRMVDNLFSMKDSLLINKTRKEIINVLGLPDKKTNEDFNYFFEKHYDDSTIVLSYIMLRFDTIKEITREAWWTD